VKTAKKKSQSTAVKGGWLKGRVGKHFATMKSKFEKVPLTEKFNDYKKLKKAGVPVAEIKIPIYKNGVLVGYSAEKLRKLKREEINDPKTIDEVAEILKKAVSKNMGVEIGLKNIGIDKEGKVKLLDYDLFDLRDKKIVLEYSFSAMLGNAKRGDLEYLDFCGKVMDKLKKFKGTL